MAQAEIKEKVNVNIDKFYQAITQYDRYPEFVDGCTVAKLTRQSDTECRVDYKVSMIKDISYSLLHRESAAEKRMEWSLITSEFMKKNDGSWTLKSAGPGQTEVLYKIEIEFNFPVPGMILNRLIKGQLPTMLKNFEKFAQKLT